MTLYQLLTISLLYNFDDTAIQRLQLTGRVGGGEVDDGNALKGHVRWVRWTVIDEKKHFPILLLKLQVQLLQPSNVQFADHPCPILIIVTDGQGMDPFETSWRLRFPNNEQLDFVGTSCVRASHNSNPFFTELSAMTTF